VFKQVRHNYDHFIFPSEGAKKTCAGPDDSLVCQFATDLELFSPKEYSKNLDFNLCFVGNKIRSDRINEQYMMCVKDKGLAIFGNSTGWQSEFCKGKISIADEAVLYSSSKICLNAHLQEHLDYGTFNFRIFNILACGGFIISDHSDFLEKEFGDCIEFTDGYWDLKNKVEHYLNKPEDRLKFREAGIKKIKEKHTFEYRMSDLLNWLGDKI
jgi:spore maturation protein CgeB